MKPLNKVAILRKGLEQRPDSAPLHLELADALAAQGDRDGAVSALQHVLELDPTCYPALHQLTRTFVRHNEFDAALAACEDSLRRVPGNTPALATRSLVLVECAKREDAAYLLNFDAFIRTVSVDVPPAFAGRPAFLEALTASILVNPDLQFEPAGRTARGGSRADLAADSKDITAEVRAMIQNAVDDYVRTLPDVDHPFISAAPSRGEVGMWTNVLREGGYHAPHIHPAAWLSGVYYVKVPSGGAEYAGALELGITADAMRIPGEPYVTRVGPEPGKLVMFPSYFYHRTIPTKGGEERISIAFDYVPAA